MDHQTHQPGVGVGSDGRLHGASSFGQLDRRHAAAIRVQAPEPLEIERHQLGRNAASGGEAGT